MVTFVLSPQVRKFLLWQQKIGSEPVCFQFCPIVAFPSDRDALFTALGMKKVVTQFVSDRENVSSSRSIRGQRDSELLRTPHINHPDWRTLIPSLDFNGPAQSFFHQFVNVVTRLKSEFFCGPLGELGHETLTPIDGENVAIL